MSDIYSKIEINSKNSEISRLRSRVEELEETLKKYTSECVHAAATDYCMTHHSYDCSDVTPQPSGLTAIAPERDEIETLEAASMLVGREVVEFLVEHGFKLTLPSPPSAIGA